MESRRQWNKFTPEDYKELWETITSGNEWHGEFHNIRKNGELYWESATISPIRNNEGKFINFIAIKEDITERKQIEKSLQESQEFTKRIIESSKDCIKVLDLKGNLLSMSEGGQTLLEIDDISIYLNKSWVDFWKGDDNIAASKAILKAKSGYTTTFSGFCKTEKGNSKWWEIIVSPIKDSNEEIINILAVSRDISERNKFEKEIILSKEKAELNEKYYHTILNNMGDPVFVKDDESKLVLVNDAFCSLFDLSREEIIGKTLAEDVTKDEMENFLKIDKQVITDGKENITEESLTVRGGETFTISTRKTRFIDENGEKFLIGIIRDLTLRKLAEEELLKHREHLSELVKERTKELEEINHELQRLNELFVGREFRIKELRDKVKNLEEKIKNK